LASKLSQEREVAALVVNKTTQRRKKKRTMVTTELSLKYQILSSNLQASPNLSSLQKQTNKQGRNGCGETFGCKERKEKGNRPTVGFAFLRAISRCFIVTSMGFSFSPGISNKDISIAAKKEMRKRTEEQGK
jgi:hypothetical protein